MTERRGLKKIVRERMARTGETYSTAHRHVVPTPAEHTHAMSALVRPLLADAGIDLSLPMICGLGGGIGFMYAVFEYAALPHPLLTIVAQHHPEPWAPAVLGRLGVSYVEQHSSSPTAALKKLAAVATSGRAAWCIVDRALLPGGGDMPEQYPVVVTGFDGSTVDILGRGRVTVDEFVAAWSGYRKGRHHLLSVTAGPATVDTGAAARSAVSTTVAHLTGPVLGHAFDVNFGLSGMRKLATEMRSSWVRRFGSPIAFPFAMRRLDECLEHEYTAPGATRPIFAAFLDEVGAGEAAAVYREAGNRWSSLSRAARSYVDSSAGVEVFAELASIVDDCVALEEQGVESLRAWLR